MGGRHRRRARRRSKTRAEEMLAQKNLDKRDMQLAEARLRRALAAQQRGRPQGYLNPTAPRRLAGAFLFFEPAAKHCGQCLKRPAALAFCARTRYNTDMNTAMIYILIMNVIGFCLMGLDKHRARTRAVARAGEDPVWRGSAGRQCRSVGRYVRVPSQDAPLVFCSGHTADPCGPAGAGCLFYALNKAGEVSRRVIFYHAVLRTQKVCRSADAA